MANDDYYGGQVEKVRSSNRTASGQARRGAPGGISPSEERRLQHLQSISNIFQRYSPQAMQAIEGPYRGGWDPMSKDPVSLLAMSTAAPEIGRLVTSNPEVTIPDEVPELPSDVMGLFARAAQLSAPVVRPMLRRVWSGLQPPPTQSRLAEYR